MTSWIFLLLAAATDAVLVPAGSHVPFFKEDPNVPPAPVAIAAFELDVRPVTNEEFLAFVRVHPEWQRSRAPRVFVDGNYLKSWRTDLELSAREAGRSPATEVSWFAAKSYCRWKGRRLPTTDEWEYAASLDPRSSARILEWYGRPTPQVLPPVGTGESNRFGLKDMHALIWEWTLDFNNAMATDEGRGGIDPALFCGSGAARAVDPNDYATFMRHAFRSSLKASYTVRNLGFRCARDVER